MTTTTRDQRQSAVFCVAGGLGCDAYALWIETGADEALDTAPLRTRMAIGGTAAMIARCEAKAYARGILDASEVIAERARQSEYDAQFAGESHPKHDAMLASAESDWRDVKRIRALAAKVVARG